MNASLKPRLSFKLYIVESMDFRNAIAGNEEGPLLEKAAQLTGLPSYYQRIINRSGLQIFLTLIQHTPLPPGTAPIIHIGCHGNSQGIELMSDERVSWDDLATWLRPVNEAHGGTLILSMSSCFGASGRMMSWSAKSLPCFVLIGPQETIQLTEGAVAWTVFYYLIQKDRENASLPLVVERMNVAVGRNPSNGFTMIESSRMQRMRKLCERRLRPNRPK